MCPFPLAGALAILERGSRYTVQPEDPITPPPSPDGEGPGPGQDGSPPAPGGHIPVFPLPRRLALKRWRPYRDDPEMLREIIRRLRQFPYMTASFIALCVVLYGMMVVVGYPPSFLAPAALGTEIPPLFGAVVGPRMVGVPLAQMEWWRALSAALLHGSVLHLAVNGIMLFTLGQITENVFGTVRFFVLCVISALGCGLLSAFMNPAGVSVGASGVLMGLVGAGIAFGFRHRSRIPGALLPMFSTNLSVYAIMVFAMALLPGLPVDHAGHLGGFLSGVVGGALFRPLVLDPPGVRASLWPLAPSFSLACAALGVTLFQVAPSIATVQDHLAVPHLRQAEEMLGRGKVAEASAQVELALKKAPDDPFVLYAAATLYLSVDQWAGAIGAFDRFAARLPPQSWPDGTGNNYAWALFCGLPEDRTATERGLALVNMDLSKSPSDPTLLNTLAYGQWLQGQYLESFKTIEKTMQVGGVTERGNDIYLYVMARAGIGDREGARKVLDDAILAWPGGVLRAEAQRALQEGWFPGGPPLEEEPPGIQKLVLDPVPAAELVKGRNRPAPPSSVAPSSVPEVSSPGDSRQDPGKDGTDGKEGDPAPSTPTPSGGPASPPVVPTPEDSSPWEPPAAEWMGVEPPSPSPSSEKK